MTDLSTQEISLLLNISKKLSGSLSQKQLRLSAGEDLLRLLNADFLASYIWNPGRRVFEEGVSINMDPKNLARYDEYFQFCDPITPALQRRRNATLVIQVMPQKKLETTEFFNDFLARDGLHHGINLYAYDGNLNIGDFRIWRGRNRPRFSKRDARLLDIVKPYFKNALRNARVHSALREASVPASGYYWEASPFACFIFDRDLNLIYRNQASRKLEREMTESQFSQLMAGVLKTGQGDPGKDNWGPFYLSAFRPAPAAHEKPHIVVHVQRAMQPKLDSRWLRSQFGLSGRESEIALLLSKGLTDKEVAQILSIAFNTVRAHIKSIFHKMEVTNRTELLHAMMDGLVDISFD